MKLNIKQCEFLDKILNAFGNDEHLDKETILGIFNNDENEASVHVNILSQLGLIRKIGEIEGSKLVYFSTKRNKLIPLWLKGDL